MHGVDTLSHVKAKSLIPAEVPTPLKLLKQADCYQQVGVKYARRGTFHSYAELLHFALAEGDSTVTTIVPKPFQLTVGRHSYVPDIYLVRGGERLVIELRPRGEFDDTLRLPLEAFLSFHGMRFVVLSNDSVLEREMEALNCLHVIRTLATATAINTEAEEHELWRRFVSQDNYMLDELLDPGDRSNGFTREVALYRLLHRGLVRGRWEHARLGRDTVIERCA